MADSMPEFAGITRDGKLVRKSQLSTGTPSLAKSQMIRPRPRKATPTAVYIIRMKPALLVGVAARAARDHRVLLPRGGRDLRAGHSYTCRYLRTSRIETKFSSRVRKNSVNPTAKIVRYSSEPAGMSPRAWAAM